MHLRLIAILLALILCIPSWAEGERGLVSRWDFDEGKGDILHDSSGKKNHGKIHGATWVKCGKGYALKFDGVDGWTDDRDLHFVHVCDARGFMGAPRS